MYRSVTLPIATVLLLGCEAGPTTPAAPLESAPSLGKTGSTNPTTVWQVPLADAGLGLVSDGKYRDGAYSLYDDAICGVRAQIFTGGGSGDATMQTNNPRAKDAQCVNYPRTMSVVYPAGDPAYPNGGKETMEVFLNLRNISNATTTIQVGYDKRVRRILSLNPPQTERCDAWRWAREINGVTYAADFVWVERTDARTYHVYTADRDPLEGNRKPGENRAICTTTGATHHLSVDLHVVSDEPLP